MADRPLIQIPLQTMDATTGEPVEGGCAGTMFLLPAREGTCETCATKHEPDIPHNAQSIFYQMRFQLEHKRSPDWRDAMEHCSEDVRTLWTDHLGRLGVDVAAGQVNPPKRGRK